jgi:hypothetical protein
MRELGAISPKVRRQQASKSGLVRPVLSRVRESTEDRGVAVSAWGFSYWECNWRRVGGGELPWLIRS